MEIKPKRAENSKKTPFERVTSADHGEAIKKAIINHFKIETARRKKGEIQEELERLCIDAFEKNKAPYTASSLLEHSRKYIFRLETKECIEEILKGISYELYIFVDTSKDVNIISKIREIYGNILKNDDVMESLLSGVVDDVNKLIIEEYTYDIKENIVIEPLYDSTNVLGENLLTELKKTYGEDAYCIFRNNLDVLDFQNTMKLKCIIEYIANTFIMYEPVFKIIAEDDKAELDRLYRQTKTNAYRELKARQQIEVNDFTHSHMIFAFDEKTFKQRCQEKGFKPEEMTYFMSGGYIRKESIEEYKAMREKHHKEIQEEIDKDPTGTFFIYQMFYAEMINHEYGYTEDEKQILELFNMKPQDIATNHRIRHGFNRAHHKALENTIIF